MAELPLTEDQQRAVLAASRNGASLAQAALAARITPELLDAALAADPRFTRMLQATRDTTMRRARWTCPGYHCGSFTGYQYGCRRPECEIAVAADKQRRRDGEEKARSRFGPPERERLLALLRDGMSLTQAAARLDVTYAVIRTARRTVPQFDEQIVVATANHPKPARPVSLLQCPGPWCGTSTGYTTYGCRAQACTQEHAARYERDDGRKGPRAKKFDAAAQARYLALVRQGFTVNGAAAECGVNMSTVYYARKMDPGFDEAVVTAALAARAPGSPGGKVRRVSRDP